MDRNSCIAHAFLHGTPTKTDFSSQSEQTTQNSKSKPSEHMDMNALLLFVHSLTVLAHQPSEADSHILQLQHTIIGSCKNTRRIRISQTINHEQT